MKCNLNTQGIQEWSVPVSGTYKIEAWGAKGGGVNGGNGAYISGSFSLNFDTTKIVVGQRIKVITIFRPFIQVRVLVEEVALLFIRLLMKVH